MVTNSMDMSLCKLQELVMDRQVCCAAVHVIVKSQKRVRDRTEPMSNYVGHHFIDLFVI